MNILSHPTLAQDPLERRQRQEEVPRQPIRGTQKQLVRAQNIGYRHLSCDTELALELETKVKRRFTEISQSGRNRR